MYSLPNGTILDPSKNKSHPSTFSSVKFCCGLNLHLGSYRVIQSMHKKKNIADARMPECTLGSNCTEKQADPGVHSLNFTCLDY